MTKYILEANFTTSLHKDEETAITFFDFIGPYKSKEKALEKKKKILALYKKKGYRNCSVVIHKES